MKYVEPRTLTRAQLEVEFNSENASRICKALISASLNDPDREYVESQIIRFLQDQDPIVRGVSATAAGHVARIHRALSLDRIVPLLKALLDHPQTLGKAEDAFDDIRMFMQGGEESE